MNATLRQTHLDPELRETKAVSNGGEALKAAMQQAGTSAAKLAELTGVSAQVVHGWLKRGVAARKAPKVVVVLGCDARAISKQYAKRVPVEIGSPGRASSFAEVPIIAWSQAALGDFAPTALFGVAVCPIGSGMPQDSLALVCGVAPGIRVGEETGMVATLIVSPSMGRDVRSHFGHIVQTRPGAMPMLRKITANGSDVILVGAVDAYPVQPVPMTDECRVIGTVVGVGIAAMPDRAAFS